MGKGNREKGQTSPPSFEQGLGRLEEIVRRLEEGEIGLAEALARYEEGVGLLRQCYNLLDSAERKIALLSGVDAEGRPVLQPLEDERHASLDEKAASRSRRRTAKKATTEPADDDIDDPPTLF